MYRQIPIRHGLEWWRSGVIGGISLRFVYCRVSSNVFLVRDYRGSAICGYVQCIVELVNVVHVRCCREKEGREL